MKQPPVYVIRHTSKSKTTYYRGRPHPENPRLDAWSDDPTLAKEYPDMLTPEIIIAGQGREFAVIARERVA